MDEDDRYGCCMSLPGMFIVLLATHIRVAKALAQICDLDSRAPTKHGKGSEDVKTEHPKSAGSASFPQRPQMMPHGCQSSIYTPCKRDVNVKLTRQ